MFPSKLDLSNIRSKRKPNLTFQMTNSGMLQMMVTAPSVSANWRLGRTSIIRLAQLYTMLQWMATSRWWDFFCSVGQTSTVLTGLVTLLYTMQHILTTSRLRNCWSSMGQTSTKPTAAEKRRLMKPEDVAAHLSQSICRPSCNNVDFAKINDQT